ncbi:MAG: hypothetical protein HY872_05550 [Chloroflexi bacterium]|nr:hypothetical protein [Chloroflexota bacterium]
MLSDYLERLKAGEEKSVLVNEMPGASIEKLLRQRIEFLQQHQAFGALDEFLAESQTEAGFDFNQYLERFWGIFRILAQTFADRDIYRYCNFNLREILIHYFRLISRILANPEEEYSASKLIAGEELVSRTKLRHYFYKWLVCGEGTIPPSEGGLLNIYRFPPLRFRALDLRILEFLYNWEVRHADDRLRLGRVASEFKRFGVTAEVLREHLTRLAQHQGRRELGLVWLDRHGKTTIASDTVVELLPAGRYFVKSVSTSREYAFWNALMVDLDQDIVGRRFTLSETYKDEFKLDVVYRFAEGVLLPELAKEKEYIDSDLVTPRDWDGSNWAYFRRCFSMDGHLYYYRLLNSVMKTIPHSSIPLAQKSHYNGKYDKLRTRFEEFEYL